MTVPVPAPRLGPGNPAVHLVEWYQPNGSTVHAGDPLCCIEAGYVTFDLEAERDGVLEQRLAAGCDSAAGELLGLIQPSPASEATESTRISAAKPGRLPSRPDAARNSGSPIAFPLRHAAAEAAAYDWDEVPGDHVDFDTGLWPLPDGEAPTDTTNPGAVASNRPAQERSSPNAASERALDGTRAQHSTGLVLRTTVTLTEAAKMRDQLTRQWAGDDLVVAFEDIVVRAVGRAWKETAGDEPDIGVGAAGGPTAAVHGAATRPFKDVVQQRTANTPSDAGRPPVRVISLLGSGIEEGSPGLEAAIACFVVGDQRQLVTFEGEVPRPVPATSLSLAVGERVLTDAQAVELLGRARALIESPYALLVD